MLLFDLQSYLRRRVFSLALAVSTVSARSCMGRCPESGLGPHDSK